MATSKDDGVSRRALLARIRDLAFVVPAIGVVGVATGCSDDTPGPADAGPTPDAQPGDAKAVTPDAKSPAPDAAQPDAATPDAATPDAATPDALQPDLEPDSE